MPGKVSPRKLVPDHIVKPSYFATGVPTETVPDFPEIKNLEQIERMRDSCKIAANILKKIENWIQVK